MTDNLAKLKSQLPGIIFKSPEEFKHRDSGFHSDNLIAGGMAIPESTEQICVLVTLCNELEIGLVCQGGRTGLSGAASTNSTQLILDTVKLNQVIDIDALGGTAIVESGIPLEVLENEVNKHGLTCGIDLAARGTATIGGMVATNAGGIEAFRNGVMRNRVFGIEAVLGDGRLYSELKRVNKANEGYDVKQLFIGSEGTLGVITKVALSLLPMSQEKTTSLVACKDISAAVQLFRSLHNHPKISLLTAEVMWAEYAHVVAEAIALESVLKFDSDELDENNIYVIFETESIGDDQIVEELLMSRIELGEINNAIIAGNLKQRNEIWRIREDSFVVDDVYPHGFWFDMSVPLGNMAQYSEQLFKRIGNISKDLKVFLFAHLGDGNFHATIATGYPIADLEEDINKAVYEGLNEWGGSFSAEHGIGTDKRSSLKKYSSDEKQMLMAGIKNLFDPKGIMNPGKVL